MFTTKTVRVISLQHTAGPPIAEAPPPLADINATSPLPLCILMQNITRRTFMSYPHKRSFWSIAIGLFLLVVGSLMLADNLHLVEVGSVWRFWPIMFIAVGIGKLFDERSAESRRDGLFWFFLGSWFLVCEFELFGLSYGTSWPLLLIGWGIAMVLRSLNIPRDKSTNAAPEVYHA